MYSPQTNIRLLSTPLENDGANTLTWNSVSEQTNYFLSKTVFSFADTTYQRKGDYMRIDKNIEELYTCNYVMYRNSAYTNKWFYAFITDYEYVNDGVTYVYIEPDEIQTWYFELQFKESFVAREHTNDDSIGANQTDEGLGTGAYIVNKKEEMYDSTPWVAMLMPLNAETSGGTITNKVGSWYSITNVTAFADKVNYKSGTYTLTYTGGNTLYLNNINIGNGTAYGITVDFATAPLDSTGQFTFTRNFANIEYLNHNYLGYSYKSALLDSKETIQSWFQTLNEKSLLDDIGAFYLVPSIVGNTSDVGNVVTKNTKQFTTVRNCDGYVPKNNKLFCYPYTIIKLHNASDSNRILQPELFYDFNTLEFEYWSDKMPSTTVVATPKNYAGALHSLEYAVNSAKYPLSSSSYDAFKNYLGIHSAEYNISVASKLRGGRVSMTGGILGNLGASYTRDKVTIKGQSTNKRVNPHTGNAFEKQVMGRQKTTEHSEQTSTPAYAGRLGGLVNGATQIAATLAEDNAKRREAFETIGTVSNNNLNASGDLTIYIEQQSVNSDYAKRIDDYFSMYGYKTNLLKVPNITGRRNWNYVQTINANITADIPNDSIDTIRSLFDGGITLWHNPETMYDYSQNNDII